MEILNSHGAMGMAESVLASCCWQVAGLHLQIEMSWLDCNRCRSRQLSDESGLVRLQFRIWIIKTVPWLGESVKHQFCCLSNLKMPPVNLSQVNASLLLAEAQWFTDMLYDLKPLLLACNRCRSNQTLTCGDLLLVRFRICLDLVDLGDLLVQFWIWNHQNSYMDPRRITKLPRARLFLL